MKKLLLIILTSISFTMSAQTGTWSGELEVQGMKIPLVFHVEEDNGNYSATMDSPQQGAMGIPVKATTVNGDNIAFDMSDMGIQYDATVTGQTMQGTFKQGGMELPLTLKFGEAEKPGNTALPSNEATFQQLIAKDKGNYKYSIEDYFEKPKASSFQLSPNGTYISYQEKDENDKRNVWVKNIKTGEAKMAIKEGEELIRGYFWANDSKLLYIMDEGGNENYHFFSANLDGSDNKDLTPFDEVTVYMLAYLKEDPEHIIIGMNKDNPEIFEPYRLNINTGNLEKLFTNNDPENPIDGYDFDKDGNLRAYTKIVNGVNNETYYSSDGKNFTLLKTLNWKDTFRILRFNYATSNPDDAYVLSNLDSDKAIIQLYDLKADKPIKTVFENKDYDAGGIGVSRKRDYEVDYFTFNGEKQEYVPVSKYFKNLYDICNKEFPNYEFGFADYDDDETTYLIMVGSDKLYGKYYTYNVKSKEFKLLYDLRPQLKEADMAEMKPITFKSRDGLTIHGYITLPKEALNGQKVPLIVNPHGGPQGVRDSWGFNSEAQLFASRGYATLQVNFRISGGYGKKFLEAGYGQVGRKCMDDVEDGIQYVIDQGWADPAKVAIYGASHGGYAVLRGMTKTPDLYNCGVDYVGVSNIYTLIESIPPYWKPYRDMLKEIWYDVDDPSQKDLIEEVSPLFNIDKINHPLLVIQGANDPRVNIKESDQIVEALRAKGMDIPYMVKYDEGHGYYNEENVIELYKVMMGFFAEHLN